MDQALDYYLKGETYYLYFDPAANAEARRLYGEAAERNPTFARAHSDLAYAMLHAWLFGWDMAITITDIRQRAEHGRDLDNDNYYGHWVLADAYLYCREFDLARSTHEHARYLAKWQAIPEDMRAVHTDWADLLLLTGHAGQAIELAQEAIANSPVPEKWFHWVLGWAYYQNEQYEQSLAALYALHNPRNAIRKNVVANHAALSETEKDPVRAQKQFDLAQDQAARFLDEEKAQGIYYAAVGEPVLPQLLELEVRIPFEQPAHAERWRHHLTVGFEGVLQP